MPCRMFTLAALRSRHPRDKHSHREDAGSGDVGVGGQGGHMGVGRHDETDLKVGLSRDDAVNTALLSLQEDHSQSGVASPPPAKTLPTPSGLRFPGKRAFASASRCT